MPFPSGNRRQTAACYRILRSSRRKREVNWPSRLRPQRLDHAAATACGRRVRKEGEHQRIDNSVLPALDWIPTGGLARGSRPALSASYLKQARGEVVGLRRSKVRAQLETAVALLAGILGILTIFWHDWIEALTGWDPDQHNGTVEWIVVVGLLAVSAAIGLVARRHWRLLAEVPGK